MANKSSNTKKKTNKSTSTKSKKIVEEKKVIEEVVEAKHELKKEVKTTRNKHIFIHSFLLILLTLSIISFVLKIMDNTISINNLISNLLLTLFTILFVVISITYHRKKKGTILLGGILLFTYFILNIFNSSNINTPILEVKNFQGKSITEVMKWASKNNIKVNQEYEYSDMIDEYSVISQSKIKNNEITVAVSEGANPYKEIIVPSMITWDDERVINFVKDNHLSNVVVEFISSDKAKDTVIEQNVSGNLKRNDELKLTFSYGEELGFNEVKLIDFTNKSKFEVEFFMKKHSLNYEFNSDFSKKIKRGYAAKQSIKAGEMVPVGGDSVIVTISKGKQIKIPNLKKMDLEELTLWAIKNKVKLSFEDKYDDSIKENEVIGFNYDEGSIIEQGTVIKVTLSRGSLKMPKFTNIDDFYDWANKYNIKYEEKHEFSDSIKAGEIIKFSYKTGQKIKNNDIIIVTISDGEKVKVPSLVGLSKSEAITKLEKANLNYSFIYQNSSTTKNKVLAQSISSGSEISRGTTITVTLSSGVEDENNYVEERRSTSTNSNTYKPANNNSNNSSSKPAPKVCNSCTITGLKNVIRSNMDSGYQATANALVSSIKSQCPGITVNVSGDSTSGMAAGAFVGGFAGGEANSCGSVSITLAR